MTITQNQLHRVTPHTQSPAALALEINLNDPTWKQTIINLQQNYYDGFRQPVEPVRQASVWDYTRKPPGELAPRGYLCPEMPMPDALIPNCKLFLKEARQGSPTAAALLHVGINGTMANLHFDWDHDYVLHACLSGTKTFYFLPPTVGWLLNPIINTSSICLPRLSTSDSEELLRITSGQRITLNAGEAVLFPSMWWHAVKYTEPSMAISLRFGEPEQLRPFRVLPRSWWLQRVVWLILQDKVSKDDLCKLLFDVLTVFFNAKLIWVQRYTHINQHYQQWLADHGEERGAAYWQGQHFNAELALADFELAPLYTPYTSPAQPTEDVRQLEEYLFACYPVRNQYTLAIANHAFHRHIGLPTVHGLVPIRPL